MDYESAAALTEEIASALRLIALRLAELTEVVDGLKDVVKYDVRGIVK